MRKLAILGVLAGLTAVSTSARAETYGMAGCGLGSIIFKDNSTLMQVLAATFNGSFSNQTFAMSSGTLNCTSGGVVKAQREQAAFAEVNFQDLKRNMASGGGEFLTSFSSLLGCEDAAKPALAKMTQEKYETILPTEATTPVQLVSNVKTQIKATPALASSCSDERAVARAEGRDKAVKQNVALGATAAATK